MTKYESETQQVERPVEAVYARFSNLSELQSLKEKLESPESRQAMAAQVGEERVESLMNFLQSATFEAERISFHTPMGAMTLALVEKEAPKLLKFALEGAPLEAYLWLQLLPTDENNARFRVTIGLELNFFMKQMVGSKVKDAVGMIAQGLRAVAATA